MVWASRRHVCACCSCWVSDFPTIPTMSSHGFLLLPISFHVLFCSFSSAFGTSQTLVPHVPTARFPSRLHPTAHSDPLNVPRFPWAPMRCGKAPHISPGVAPRGRWVWRPSGRRPPLPRALLCGRSVSSLQPHLTGKVFSCLSCLDLDLIL